VNLFRLLMLSMQRWWKRAVKELVRKSAWWEGHLLLTPITSIPRSTNHEVEQPLSSYSVWIMSWSIIPVRDHIACLLSLNYNQYLFKLKKKNDGLYIHIYSIGVLQMGFFFYIFYCPVLFGTYWKAIYIYRVWFFQRWFPCV
jgi:hypothetical protein